MTVLKVITGNTDPGEEKLSAAGYSWVWHTKVADKSHLYPTTESFFKQKHASLAPLICKSFSFALQHLHFVNTNPPGCKAGTCWARRTQRNSDWDSCTAQQHKNDIQPSPGQETSYQPHTQESCRAISKEGKSREGKMERKSKFASIKKHKDLVLHSHIVTASLSATSSSASL